MKIIILGKNGMLGSDLVSIISSHKNNEVIALGRDRVDITRMDQIKQALLDYSPDILINATAIADVEGCQTDPLIKDQAFSVNGRGVQNLAESCLDFDCTLVHYSTDYVFDGKEKKYKENFSCLRPLNVYGVSKALGESSLAKIQKWARTKLKFYLIRTSWLFGRNGKNFVKTMLDLASKKKTLNIVADQFGSPTYTRDLAERTSDLLHWDQPYGIYHITNSGICSWYDFAKEIFRLSEIQINLNPISSKEYPSKVIRPSHAHLVNTKLPELRSWKQALEAYLNEHH